MAGLKKRLSTCAVASCAVLFLLALPGAAQEEAGEVAADGKPEAAETETGELLAKLSEPGLEDWQAVEAEIQRRWSRSGSVSMDLLLRRGNEAMERGDLAEATGHFTALTEQAPDFAEGWNGRATAWFLMGEYGLSVADVEQVLRLNPEHFGALSGLAMIFEQSGQNDLALRALEEVARITPNRPQTAEMIERLKRQAGEAEL